MHNDKDAIIARFDLTSLVSEEIISLLLPQNTMNPLYWAAAGLCGALVLYCAIVGNDANVVLVVMGAFLVFVCLVGAKQLRTLVIKRLVAQRLYAPALPKILKKQTVTLFPAQVVFEQGNPPEYTYSYDAHEVRSVVFSDKLLLVKMAGGKLVPIPRKALSLHDYTKAQTMLEEMAHQ